MGGYGGWGGGVNLGGYAPATYTPNAITPVQPAQPQPVAPGGGYDNFAYAGQGGGSGYPPGFWESVQASDAADQSARIVYSEWMMRHGDEQLALQKAQQAWTETYQTAGLTGTLNGQQTLPAQQQYWSQGFNEQQLAEQQTARGQQGALSLLGLQAQLTGPRDWQKYWGLAASAPQGLQSALSSLAGRYQYAPGYQGTPGPATLGSRTQDLLSGGNLGAAGQGAQGGPAAGAGQAGNAWGWNLQNWQRMSPSMQQGVLGAAEAGGAYGPDLEALLKQAAPRYSGPGATQIGL